MDPRPRARARSRAGSPSRYSLPHLDTGLLYRATAAALVDQGRDLGDVNAAVAAARGLALTDFDQARLRSREMRRGGLDRRGAAGAARGADPGAARFRAASGRRGARRARHRNGDLPAGRRENLRHRLARGARAASRAGACRARRKGRLSARSSRTSPGATPAIPGRAVAPLKAAPDAAVLDTTRLSVEAAFAEAARIVDERRGRREG